MTNVTNENDQATSLDESVSADKIVLFALDEARQKLEQNGEFEPFTVIMHGDDLFVETHPGADIIACFNSAQQTLLEMAVLADAYVFAYDGYVELDDEQKDALIAERGIKGESTAEAFALLYVIDESEDGSLTFDDGIYSLGPAPSLYTGEPLESSQLEEL
jgi:hypothetical protein